MKLREFDDQDWSAFAGCEPISNDREPMIGEIYIRGWPTFRKRDKMARLWRGDSIYFEKLILHNAYIVVDRDSIHIYDDKGSWWWLDIGWPKSENFVRSLNECIDSSALIQWGFHYIHDGGWQLL